MGGHPDGRGHPDCRTGASRSLYECGQEPNGWQPGRGGFQLPHHLDLGWLQHRVDQGLVDLTTGEGFSGLIGIDITGDGVADLSTFLVGPTFAIPDVAQLSGAPCHGTVSIEEFFSNCLS